MNTTAVDLQVRAYLEAVKARLEDLPEEERDDLIIDLEQHLVEVAAEDDGTLVERLGPPADYAEELRSSAGLPSRRTAVSERLRDRLSQSAAGRLIAPFVRELRTSIPDLRPGWWVLRGYLVIMIGSVIAAGGGHTQSDVPLPYAGSYAVGIVAILAAAWVSVILGRRARVDGRARRFEIFVNAVVVLASLVALAQLESRAAEYQSYSDTAGEIPQYLQHSDGSSIANICPYGSDGKLLSGVLLFDQDGRPITETAQPDIYVDPPPPPAPPAISNAYPKQIVKQDPGPGRILPLTCPSALAPAGPVSPAPMPTASAAGDGG